MTRANMSLIGIAAGVVLAVGDLYGWFGVVMGIPAVTGLLIVLVGTGALLSTQSLEKIVRPSPYVCALVVAGVLLHLYENLVKSSGGFSSGFLLWSSMPYLLTLCLSSFKSTKDAAIAGGALALSFDAFAYHDVFVDPRNSTVGLALIFVPLWNILIVVPAGTFLTWIVLRKRAARSA